MENTPQEKKKSCGSYFIGTIIAVIVAFLAGVFVGLHPDWIPINTTANESQPVMSSVPGATAPREPVHPEEAPQTQPTTEPSGG